MTVMAGESGWSQDSRTRRSDGNLREAVALRPFRRGTARSQHEGVPAADRGGKRDLDGTCRGWRGASRRTPAAANEREKPPRRGGAPASNGKPAEAACLQRQGVDGVELNPVHVLCNRT